MLSYKRTQQQKQKLLIDLVDRRQQCQSLRRLSTIQSLAVKCLVTMIQFVKDLIGLNNTSQHNTWQCQTNLPFFPGALTRARGPKQIPNIKNRFDPMPPFCKKGSHYSRLYCLIYRVIAGKNILNILNRCKKFFKNFYEFK